LKIGSKLLKLSVNCIISRIYQKFLRNVSSLKFQKLDKSYLGKSCFLCNLLAFRRILTVLPTLYDEMETRDLSTDQRYLYEICEAISNEVVSQSLAEINPDNLCSSR
jgi:hypothetical protein